MTCAFTRVYDRTDMLRSWLRYYSQHFDNLQVIGCQCDENILADLKSEYKFEYFPTGDQIHSVESLNTISTSQKSLFSTYEWVLYSDMDEFVIPAKGTLKNYMTRCRQDQTFCEGYDVYRVEDEAALDRWKPIFEQRHYWWRDISGSYNKPLLSRVPTNWVLGYHKVADMSDSDVMALDITKSGLYLAHLRHVDELRAKDALSDRGGKSSEIPANIRRKL